MKFGIAIGFCLAVLALLGCGEYLSKDQVDLQPLQASIIPSDSAESLLEAELPAVEREGGKARSKAGAYKNFINVCIQYAQEFVAAAPNRVGYDIQPASSNLVTHRPLGVIAPLETYSFKGTCTGIFFERGE